MPRPDRSLFGPLVLAAGMLAAGCGEAPTEPPAPTAGTELERLTEEPAAAFARTGDAEGAADLTLEELRARLSDPLVRDLFTGIEDPTLQASLASPLGTLSEEGATDPAALRTGLREARRLLEDASEAGSLTAADELAVSVLRLVLIEAPARPRTHRAAPSEPAATVPDTRDPDHREEQP